MFLEWNDIYSVNIKEIDSQHKNLFSLINKVQFSDKDKPNTKEEINKILDEMNDYAIYHFDTEEKYFNPPFKRPGPAQVGKLRKGSQGPRYCYSPCRYCRRNRI